MDEMNLERIFGSYTAWKADESTWFINFMNGSENMYLLEGDEKAYMSRGYLDDAPSVENPGATPFDIKSLPHNDYEKITVGEGYKIELGNRTIEVIDVKNAHCNSGLFFLDRGHRMFFCGDELESAQVLLYDNSKNPKASYDVKQRLDNFKDNCLRIKSLADEFDMLLPDHNGAPISKGYIDEYIELVDKIFEGTALIEDKLNHPFIEMDPKAPQLCRVRNKNASIFIKKELLMNVYGGIK